MQSPKEAHLSAKHKTLRYRLFTVLNIISAPLNARLNMLIRTAKFNTVNTVLAKPEGDELWLDWTIYCSFIFLFLILQSIKKKLPLWYY